MKERSLKGALVAVMALCVVLVAALAYMVWREQVRPQAEDISDPVVARGPAAGTNTTAAAKASEPALTSVQLSPQRMREIGVTTAVAEMKDVSDALQVPGNVAMDEGRISYVQTRFAGWIRNVYANATYQYVKKGQRLFTVYSPDLVSTEQEYLLANKNHEASGMRMQGMASQESGWLVQAAKERLRRFDLPEAEVERLEKSGTVQREMVIESPATGYIIERNALPNGYVQPDTKLYTIADLSTIWVYANVFQNDVGRLKPGDGAQVTVDAYPGRTFKGRVEQILPDVDAATRTVRVRLVFRNPGLVLKPGMYVNVQIAAPLGRQLVIPASGVLQAGMRQIAFLDRGQGLLEPREIETGPRVDDSVVVLKGLKAGDRIVSSANFLVDSEAQLQSAMGGAAPQAAPAASEQMPQAQMELSTLPSPPHRGANTVRVMVKGADGKPMAGAQVNVTFYMPAMPAMGMAAIRVAATLTDKGQGMYEGSLQLGSGGTWDVTLTATRNGQTVAMKQMRVNATGGM